MPPIYISSQQLLKRYIGETEVSAVYVGIQEAFSAIPSMLLGMNLGWVNSYSGGWPFANICKNMGGFAQVSGSGAYTQNQGELIASVSTDRFRAYISDSGNGLPAGTYTVRNPDGCTVAIGEFNNATYWHPWTTATQFTFNYTPGTFLGLWVEGSLTRASGNLEIILPGHFAGYLAGDIWNSDFLSYYAALNIKTLRTMDWTLASQNIEMDWSERAAPNRICNIRPKSYGPVMPWETICALANRLGVDPWVCVPVRATVDYVQNMAAVFAANLDSSRKVYLELGNEVWNYTNPWSDGTRWVEYLDHAVKVATANAGDNTYTLAGHGMTHGHRAVCFGSPNNREKGASVSWEAALGNITYVEVIDSNTFRLHSGSIGGAVVPVSTEQVDLWFKHVEEAGKVADLNAHYGELSLRNFQIFDTALGATRVEAVIATQVGNSTYTAQRLAVPGVSERCDFVAIAPYFQGGWFGAAIDVSDQTLTPRIWVSNSATVYAAVYPAASSPTIAQVIAGTGGAISHQIYAASYVASNFTSLTAVSGLVNGTNYEVRFVVADGLNNSWMMSATASPNASASTQYVYDTYTNQMIRNIISTEVEGLAWIDAQKGVIGNIPLISYECGLHFHHTAPAQVWSWMSSYLESPEFVNALRNDFFTQASRGLKIAHHYSDFRGGSTFSITPNYTIVSGPRYALIDQLDGRVPLRSRVEIANASPAAITAQPVFPHVVHIFPNGLAYSIANGNTNGNYSIVGRELRMVNDAGVSWSDASIVSLKILATDGFTYDTAQCVFSIGNLWLETDAALAWSSKTDTTTGAMNPVYGGNIPLVTGAGAVVVGDLWDMDGCVYRSDTVLPAGFTGTEPILVAHVVARDNQTSTDSFILYMPVSGGGFVGLRNNTANMAWRYWSGSVNTVRDCTPPNRDLPTVYWHYYDPATLVWSVGYNQVTTATADSIDLNTKTYDRRVVVGGDFSVSRSQSMHGSLQVVRRAGMTLSEAKAIVAKMQVYHGIA